MAAPSTPRPTPKMTGFKRVLSYAFAAIFDFLKFLFDMFIFTAPVIAGLVAAAVAGQSSWFSWIPSSWVATAVGGGVAGLEILQPEVMAGITFFGLMMAMAIGFAGGLLLILWYLACGIALKDILLWWGLGMGASIIPGLNLLPTLSGANWQIVSLQHKKDRQALKDWEAANAKNLEQQKQEQLQRAQAEVANAQAQALELSENPI